MICEGDGGKIIRINVKVDDGNDDEDVDDDDAGDICTLPLVSIR